MITKRLFWTIFAILLSMPCLASADELDIYEDSGIPLGYTQETWQQFLDDAVIDGELHDIGGIDVYVVAADEPLTYIGDVSEVELVYLEEEEMADLGLFTGDELADSNDLYKKIAVEIEGTSGDIGSDITLDSLLSQSDAFGAEMGTMGSGDPYYGQLWNRSNGSGLVYAKNTFIRVVGRAAANTWLSRKGTANFYNERSGVRKSVPFSIPFRKFPKVYTTFYSRMIDDGSGNLIWVVSYPWAWIALGENGWDNIGLQTDLLGYTTNPVHLMRINIVHNSTKIMKPLMLFPPEQLTYKNMTPFIDQWKDDSVAGVSHTAVFEAIDDLGQGASLCYPVFATNWDPDPPGGDTYLVPYPWCSEFVSWAFQQNDPTLYTSDYIPRAAGAKHPALGGGFYGPDIGVTKLLEWSDLPAIGRLGWYAHQTSIPDNGTSASDWTYIGNNIGPGDYVSWYHCTDAACGAMKAHSMVVVGWADSLDAVTRLPNSIASSNFDDSRACNLLWVISGNWNNYPGTGLGLVAAHSQVVCGFPDRDPVTNEPVPPFCGNIDGIPGWEKCNISLWDPHENNGEPEGDFFMYMP